MSAELTPDELARISAEQRAVNRAMVKKGAAEQRGQFYGQLKWARESIHATRTAAPHAARELRVLRIIVDASELGDIGMARALKAIEIIGDALECRLLLLSAARREAEVA